MIYYNYKIKIDIVCLNSEIILKYKQIKVKIIF